MSRLTERALEVRGNAAHTPALEYATVRWVELLDPATHFSRSATSVIDPVSAMRDFRGVAEDFIDSRGVKNSEVFEWLRLLATIIRLERNLVPWFGDRPRRRLLQALRRAEQPPSSGNKDTWLRRELRRLLQREFGRYEALLLDPSTGYRARLLDAVAAGLTAATTPQDSYWIKFDEDLSYLATLAQAEGRDATSLAEAVLDAWNEASDASDAMLRLRAILAAPQADYVVAFVVEGVGSLPDLAEYDARRVNNPARWPDGTPSANGALTRFVKRHKKRGITCAIFTVKVQAYDATGAHSQASLTARRLASHLVAQHRVADIRVRREALVWRVGAATTQTRPRAPRAASRGRLFRSTPIDALADSLSSYARAREERAPAWSAMASWSALDALAVGAMTERQIQARLPAGRCPICRRHHSLPAGTHLPPGAPCPCCSNPLGSSVGWPPGTTPAPTTRIEPQSSGAFLPPHCGAVIVLASARYAVAGLWHALLDAARHGPHERKAEQLQLALASRPSKRTVDLDLWTEIIRAADGSTSAPVSLDADVHGVRDAGAFVHELAHELGPFTAQWLWQVRGRLLVGQRLFNWASNLERRAEVQMARTKFLRHGVVHRATHHTDSALQLMEAAQHIVDGVYEVLPYWLDGREPWEALRDARLRYQDLLDRWQTPRKPQFAAQTLSRP
jgi:hypothetical protein